MNEKQLRANATVLLCYPEYADNPLRPTASDLNDQFAYTTNEDAMVFNVSCGIEDSSFVANFPGSETNNERSLCDKDVVENPTSKNYEFSFSGWRDFDVDAKGLYNMIWRLVQTAGRPLIAIVRIGHPQNAQFANGQDISIFKLLTDNPGDNVDTGSYTKYDARFIADGGAEENYRIGVDS